MRNVLRYGLQKCAEILLSKCAELLVQPNFCAELFHISARAISQHICFRKCAEIWNKCFCAELSNCFFTEIEMC